MFIYQELLTYISDYLHNYMDINYFKFIQFLYRNRK